MSRGAMLVAGAVAALAVGQAVSGYWGVGRYQVATVAWVNGDQETVLLDTTLGEARLLVAVDGQVVWSEPVPNWSQRQK